MNLSSHSPFSSKASQLLSWGHWFTFANIGLVLLITLSYLAADKAPTTALGWLYMLVTWLSHTSFITFCVFVLSIFPLSLIFPYPRHIRGMAACIATLGITVLGVDAFVYFQLGYHLNLQALPEILSLFWKTISSSPAINSLIVLAMIAAILGFELIVGNHAWRHLERLKRYSFPKFASTILVTCFASSHIMHIWADANSYFDITMQDNVLPLSYPTTAKTLLARHELLDMQEYNQARSLNVGPNEVNYHPPASLASCPAQDTPVSLNIVKTLSEQTEQQLMQLGWHGSEQLLAPTLREDFRFNLLYGLPAYYKQSLMDSKAPPVWSTRLSLSVSGLPKFTYISPVDNANVRVSYSEQSPLITEQTPPTILIVEPNSSDIVTTTRFFTNIPAFEGHTELIQISDIMTTIAAEHFQCSTLATASMLGNNVATDTLNEGVNYSRGVLVAYKKDRITLIAQDGSYKQVSAKEGFTLDQKLDVPFLIQSIKRLKQFNQTPATK
ncbi:hypothetical protein PRUB_a1154 [Pseudoalteromonas rubra]|uniref:Inner membrane protein YejM N-terminal domain-containing protein n=1 Tax=Pseudoalteromonas rubra TaxID=43658 RepID=A0A8T0C832_9GAMM|nr:DUF3413 domain-containing protein [Pseudoalteromonas rubra]KAF7786548.1 hypothetical protein PRUB_a1154 [Pseudoalteromonas rubra]